MPVQFLTTNQPSNTSIPDGTNPPALAGKAGEAVVAELHGKFYTAAYRNRVFAATTAAAGTVIPIGTTTTMTFALFNPLGSGVNVELVSIDVASTTTTWVASPIQLGLLSGAVLPTTITSTLTSFSTLVGGSGVSQIKVYASAVGAAMPTTALYPLFSVGTTAGTPGQLHYEFDGRVILAPGTMASLVGTAAQSQATVNAAIWIEWPL
jgi:hypothetical protein